MNDWHQRRVNAAEAVAADDTIATRLKFYIGLTISNPNSPAAPYANALGIIVNVMGLTKEEGEDYIRNETILVRNRS